MARVLYAEGWKPIKARHDKIVLWNGDSRPIALVLNLTISLKRVRAICKAVNISAERFDALFREAPQADFSVEPPLFRSPQPRP